MSKYVVFDCESFHTSEEVTDTVIELLNEVLKHVDDQNVDFTIVRVENGEVSSYLDDILTERKEQNDTL